MDALDGWRAGRVHVGRHRWVLGLRKGPLGQRHLAGRLRSHFWGWREPLRLALWVVTAIALPSLLKATRQHTGESPHKQASPPAAGPPRLVCDREAKPPNLPFHQSCQGSVSCDRHLGFGNIFEI